MIATGTKVQNPRTGTKVFTVVQLRGKVAVLEDAEGKITQQLVQLLTEVR